MKDKRKIKFTISDLNNENPFIVPGNYFEEFNEKLKKRIDKEIVEKKSKPLLHIRSRLILTVAAAAAISGVLLALKIWLVNPAFQELRKNEITTLLQLESYDLDDFELEVGIDQSYTSKEATAIIEAEAYKDAIITYLVDEQIDLETLANEL